MRDTHRNQEYWSRMFTTSTGTVQRIVVELRYGIVTEATEQTQLG
jgi:hypothetical protein